MALTIYMGITNPNIGNGDSKDTQATFKLLSLSFSAVAPVNPNGSIAGKPSVSPITVTLDAIYAPQLFGSLLTGQTHTVTFTVEKPNVKSLNPDFEVITLDNALVTLFQETFNSADTAPTLELSFSYRRLSFTEPSTEGDFIYIAGGGLG